MPISIPVSYAGPQEIVLVDLNSFSRIDDLDGDIQLYLFFVGFALSGGLTTVVEAFVHRWEWSLIASAFFVFAVFCGLRFQRKRDARKRVVDEILKRKMSLRHAVKIP
jgi:hypothetical protein